VTHWVLWGLLKTSTTQMRLPKKYKINSTTSSIPTTQSPWYDVWYNIPSHNQILGNERADEKAHQAIITPDTINLIVLPYTTQNPFKKQFRITYGYGHGNKFSQN